MSDNSFDEECIDDPMIRQLVRDLKRLPEILAEKEKRIRDTWAFNSRVFEPALRKAGLLPPLEGVRESGQAAGGTVQTNKSSGKDD